jgi:hypothetical protein
MSLVVEVEAVTTIKLRPHLAVCLGLQCIRSLRRLLLSGTTVPS